ncbi:uncharacterized protein LOC143284685 [Babylonia areolata]|uniref:uncharacterized protein LOC143284685 n=1 Tax=Babylonia areolata TaxID=304850 RepID=UPI003FD3C1D9
MSSKMSNDEFCRSKLKVAAAQICQNLGWNSTTTLALDILLDTTERYIEQLGKATHRFSELYGRTEPNLNDLGLAFRLNSVNLNELEEYVRHVEPVPFGQESVAFPAQKANSLQIPSRNSREIRDHREEHIHDHLPPMFPGMEDDAEEQQGASALTQASKNEGLESLPSDSTAPVAAGEKRPVPVPHDLLTPGKRARMNVSSLPEEAGHSQYEMSNAIMAPDGTLLGLRGRGKLPQACPPPPTVRISTAGPSAASGSSKGGEGSDTNKDKTPVDPPPKESSVRKEGSSGISGSGESKGKPEPTKTKGKKKEKCVVEEKDKKQKKKSKAEPEKKVKLLVGAKRPASASIEPGSTPPAKKLKLKEGKTLEGKSKVKTSKGDGIKKKAESKKKPASSPVGRPSSSTVNESGSESCLKDLLLSPDKFPVSHSQPAPSASSASLNLDVNPSASPESDMLLRQIFPPTDVFDTESCETSPQRLIIVEAEGRAQEKEEEKRIRLKNIDDTISAVIRNSATNGENKKPQAVVAEKPVPPVNVTEVVRKRGRPKKTKGKEKIKSSEFIADDVIMQEKEDEMGARSMKSITDTIDAVIRQGSEDSKPSPKPVSTDAKCVPAVHNVAGTPNISQTPVKEGKKKKLEKEKAPGVKKKLKAKLQNKTEKDGESAPLQSPVDLKPFVSDKFSNAEMKVFEFGEADSPPPLLERRPSQAEREWSPKELSPLPVPSTPLLAQDNFSPVDVKQKIKSPTPESAVAPASSVSPSSAASVDQHLIMPLKIEIPKDKERHREKSRDKEHHRKDKKEKRRDKEKKKKNKDKDRDKERHEKHEHKHEKYEKNRIKEETPPAGQTGLKLKIKFGSKDNSSSSSVVVTDSVGLVDSDKQLPSPTPRRESLKLVIRHDAAEGTSSQKKYSSVVSTPAPKSEPRNTPPTLQPASPFPGTPPPPVLSRNSSPVRKRSPSPPPSPPVAKPNAARSRSPVCKSPPHPEEFTFTSPQSSPIRNRPCGTPPPRTPSASPKSPSPMPKTPSPKHHIYPGSPFSFSSPIHASPAGGRKSPTPTPKTPSLSPVYHLSSPLPDHSPVRQDKSPPAVRQLFGTREHGPAPLSPLVPSTPAEVMPSVQAEPTPPPVVPKPKGKVGRPRLKSPKAAAPKKKSPKSPKGVGKTAKAVSKTNATGKPAGRGRPPKAKTLALRAALAANTPEAPPKPKTLTPPPPEVQRNPVQKTPAASSLPPVEVEKSGLDSSPESPSPTQLSVAFPSTSSSRQRGTVETETVGSYIDSKGIQVWICPACKMQDDGSPMIGCDKCDDWYHWVCVNITTAPPEEEQWYCPRCSAKEIQIPVPQVKPKGKRGRKKKNAT